MLQENIAKEALCMNEKIVIAYRRLSWRILHLRCLMNTLMEVYVIEAGDKNISYTVQNAT